MKISLVWLIGACENVTFVHIYLHIGELFCSVQYVHIRAHVVKHHAT